MPFSDVRVRLWLLDADCGDSPAAGQRAPLDIGERFLSLRHVDGDGKKDKLEINLRNEDLKLVEEPAFEKGQKIAASWGYPGFMSPPRKFVVKNSEGLHPIKVVCIGMVDQLDSKVKLRRWENLTDAEIATKIAKEYGYDGALLHIQTKLPGGLALPRLDSVTQRLTDARFLLARARANGMTFYVDHIGFHWHEHQNDAEPYKVYVWNDDPTQGDILKLPNIEVDLARDVAKVKVVCRDPLTMEMSEFYGGADNAEFTSLGNEDPVGDPEVGPEQGVRQYRLARMNVKWAGLAAPSRVKVTAQSMYRSTASGKYKLSLHVKGDPYLTARKLIDLRGVGDTLGGLYALREVETTVAPGNFSHVLKGVKDAASEVKAAIKKPVARNRGRPDMQVTTGDYLELKQVLVAGKGPSGETEYNYVYIEEQPSTQGKKVNVDFLRGERYEEGQAIILEEAELLELSATGQSELPDV